MDELTHTVWFNAPIQEDLCNDLILDLKTAVDNGKKKIFLALSSIGGANQVAYDVYNFISTLDVELTTCALSKVESCALLIYCSGKERLVTDYSKFYFHRLTWNNQITLKNIDYVKTILERDEKIHTGIISAATGKAPEEIFAWMNDERFVYAGDALNDGLSTRFATMEEMRMPDSIIVPNK